MAGALTCAAMGWFAFAETSRQIARGVLTMAAHPFPKWWISVWIAIGFALTTLEFLRLALGAPTLPNALDTES
jgi:TRAP-type C4-dicarboxylate transport system permease small subunit